MSSVSQWQGDKREKKKRRGVEGGEEKKRKKRIANTIHIHVFFG